jgi:hypothetical protein
MIAATLLVTLLLASLRSQTSSTQLMKTAGETELATEILREAMAQAFLASNDELVNEGGSYSPGAPLALTQSLGDQVVTYSLPDYDGGATPAFLSVLFRVQWTSDTGQTRELALRGGKR